MSPVNLPDFRSWLLMGCWVGLGCVVLIVLRHGLSSVGPWTCYVAKTHLELPSPLPTPDLHLLSHWDYGQATSCWGQNSGSQDTGFWRGGKRWEHSVLEPESVDSWAGRGSRHDTCFLMTLIVWLVGLLGDISTMNHVNWLCAHLLPSLLETLV